MKREWLQAAVSFMIAACVARQSTEDEAAGGSSDGCDAGESCPSCSGAICLGPPVPVAKPGAHSLTPAVLEDGFGVLADERGAVDFRFLRPNGQGGVSEVLIPGTDSRYQARIVDLDGSDPDELVYCSDWRNHCEAAVLQSGRLEVIEGVTGTLLTAMAPQRGDDARLFLLRQLSTGNRWQWRFLGDGDFEWRETPQDTFESLPVIADFDGDGALDVVVEYRSTLRLFEVLEGGGLEERAIYERPYGADAMSAADLDGDGRAELLVSCSDRLEILGFPAPGVVERSSPIADMFRLRHVATGDLDGDQRTDIIALAFDPEQDSDEANPRSRLVVAAQVQPAVFQTATFDLPIYVNAALPVDLDDDGDLDLLVSNYDVVYALANDRS